MNKTIKIFIALILGSFSFLNFTWARQNEPINMRCITEFPTTSFLAYEEGENLKVDIIHHNGVQYTPFRGALITPSDIPLLSKKAEMFLKLSPTMTFQWKKSSCQIEGPLFFQCFGAAEVLQVNGIKVEPKSIMITESTEKMIGYEYSKRTVVVSFDVDKESYTITNDFFGEDCYVGSKLK